MSDGDLTPKWSEVLPRMMEFMATGTDEQRSLLRIEFQRMARCADAYNAMNKAIKAAQATMAAELPRMIDEAALRAVKK